MQRQQMPKKKNVPMPVVIVVIVVVLGIAAILIWRGTQNYGVGRGGSISDEMIQRSKSVNEAWKNEVELAKKENRPPNEALRPGPKMEALVKSGRMPRPGGGAGGPSGAGPNAPR
jgi:hypothetical protein